MGQIRHFNNGKWTIYTSGEGLSAYTGNSNTYYIGADLDNNGNYSKANPDGTLVDMEGGAGISSLIDITYNELYSKVVNGELIPSQWYRLTDYRSVNFLNGWRTANDFSQVPGPNFNPKEIYTGETEVLIIQATSEYQISPIGYSETYPNDIVQYEPYTNKIGINQYFSNFDTLPDSTPITGFDLQWDSINNEVYFNMPTGYPVPFGHYFYLYCEFDGGNYFQNGCFDPITPGISICQYPYSTDDIFNNEPKAVSRIRVENAGQKVVLIDLDYNDFLNYNINTLEVETIYEIGDAYGWISRRQDIFRNVDVPFDFKGIKYRRFEIDFSGTSLSSIGKGYYSIGITPVYLNSGFTSNLTGNYYDFNTLGLESGWDVLNVSWNDYGGPDGGYWYRGSSENNVFINGIRYNTINRSVFNNTFAKTFDNNTINATLFGNISSETVHNNSFKGYIYENIFNSFSNNVVEGSSYKNLFTGCLYNVFNSSQFSENKFKSSAQYNSINSIFTVNIIDGGFSNNIIYGTFSNNTSIANGFYDNKMYSSFQGNIINNFSFKRNTVKTTVNSITFNPGAIACSDFDSEIIMASGYTNYITYFNGTSIVGVTPINS